MTDLQNLSPELADLVRSHFTEDRNTRFDLLRLAQKLRSEHYLHVQKRYRQEFIEWFEQHEMAKLFQSFKNFSKYAIAGDLVTRYNDLDELPTSVGALYELAQILHDDPELFEVCRHYTPSRKSVDAPKHEWKTKKPALVNPFVTAKEVSRFRKKWNNPTVTKSSGSRVVPLLHIAVNDSLFDFDPDSGEHVGSVSLNTVNQLVTLIQDIANSFQSHEILFEHNLDEIKQRYKVAEAANDPAINILDDDAA